MNRKITCTNEDGVGLTLTSAFSPFLLQRCDGIYQVKSAVATSENTMTDGSTYQGSNVQMRNIVLTLADKEKHKSNRELLYKVFKPKSYGTFVYEEEDEKKRIQYVVESIDADSEKPVRVSTISLLCPDPFFVDMHDITVTMAGWEAGWHWPHSFIEEGEPFGTRIVEMLKTINNDSAADNIGMTITMSTTGTVVNPSVYRVESSEYIKVGTSARPFSMAAGEKLIITTGTNDKHVYLQQGTEMTEINQYLSEDSEFIQLMRGSNTIGYEADAGGDYLTVEVSFRYRYLGV